MVREDKNVMDRTDEKAMVRVDEMQWSEKVKRQ